MNASFGLRAEIKWSLKIPEIFMRLILQDEFWFMHIPFGSMVKFQFLTRFPADLLPHPVVPSFIIPLS